MEALEILGGNLPIEQQRAALETTLKKSPAAAAAVTAMLLNQMHHYKRLAENNGRALEELRKQMEAAPLHPVTVLARLPGRRALVASGTRRFGVALAPGLDPESLTEYRAVFLNASQNAVVELAPEMPRAGVVGRFSRWHGAQAVVRGPADEEFVLDLPERLRQAGLANGDLLLYERDALFAWDKVETKHEHAGLLVEIKSDLRISRLGALDDIYQEIMEDIDLHLLHPELAQRHRLDPLRGLLLTGPPGVGKTSLVCCIGNGIAELRGLRVRVLLFPPSAHRSKWYGETEERVRAMFEEARRAAREPGCYILLLIDDADQVGSRDTTNDVDARVLPVFLHEVERLQSVDRLLTIAATNKPEMVDPALLRAGRFGDREYRIPRPGTRAATRQILRCYLTADVPYRYNGSGPPEACEAIIEEALSALYSPNGELATLATLHFRDGSSRPVTPAMLVAGSLLRNAAKSAKQRSCRRALRGGPVGVTSQDLLAALAAEFATLVSRLKPGPGLHAQLELPPDLDVVRVDARAARTTQEYLRAPAH